MFEFLQPVGLFGVSPEGVLYTPGGRPFFWLPLPLAGRLQGWLNEHVSQTPQARRFYRHRSVTGDIVRYKDDLWRVSSVINQGTRIFLHLHSAVDPFRLICGEVEQNEIEPASTLELLAVAAKIGERRS